jgi:hypothetical protein
MSDRNTYVVVDGNLEFGSCLVRERYTEPAC